MLGESQSLSTAVSLAFLPLGSAFVNPRHIPFYSKVHATAGCELHFMANQISLLSNPIIVFVESVMLAVGRQCMFVVSSMHIRFNGKKSTLQD